MVVDSELLNLSIPERYLEYSEAYLNSASTLNSAMLSGQQENSWPNAAVVLMLSAHAVELFLKGAMYFKDANAHIAHHNIETLYKTYLNEYKDQSYFFEMPFISEYPSMSEAEIQALQKEVKPPLPSILYRYPTESSTKEWGGAQGFEASSFSLILSKLQNDFKRLRNEIT